MSQLLKLTGPNHEALIKEAFWGMATKGLGALAKKVGTRFVQRPISTTFGALSTAATGADAISKVNRAGSAARMGEQAAEGAARLANNM